MINSTLYQNVTYKQISDMKHALGFDNRKIRGTKHRKYEPYRNYYNTGAEDINSWQQLVSIGFAEKVTENWYCVTEDGRCFLSLVTGVEILPVCN